MRKTKNRIIIKIWYWLCYWGHPEITDDGLLVERMAKDIADEIMVIIKTNNEFIPRKKLEAWIKEYRKGRYRSLQGIDRGVLNATTDLRRAIRNGELNA